ncbi:helix-turn-helix domain-containing protein [Ruminococcaceae bacterium OttesenSCG-928-L11]|nr:helix-turn-helix domain-containing protein [Ruminococcaceae bacterium OttesenSCG-928-L11]
MNALVVDDQYEVAQGVIQGVDWRKLSIDKVFPAYSVKEAKQVMERNPIDILLCDIEMPPTNGFALVQWVQEHYPDVITIFLSSHAEFEYAREAVKLGGFDYVLQPAPYEEIEAAVERAINRAGETEKRYTARIEQSAEDTAEIPDPDSEDLRPIERAQEYIRKHIHQDLSRTEIAEAIFLNPEYLSHLFRRETGSSLGEYILSERMKIAKSLLADTDIKISVIASKVGYANFSYFSSVFKKSTGVSPMEYRSSCQKDGAPSPS